MIAFLGAMREVPGAELLASPESWLPTSCPAVGWGRGSANMKSRDALKIFEDAWLWVKSRTPCLTPENEPTSLDSRRDLNLPGLVG